MKRFALFVLFATFTSTAFSADEIIAGGGVPAKGWVIQITPKYIFAIADGKRQHFPLQSTLKFDLATQPRIAAITTNDDKQVLITLNAWTNVEVQGETQDGKLWTCKPADLKSADFMACSRFARTLPVNHVKQKPDYCGEACVEMVSEYLGRKVSQDEVNKAGGLDGKRGVYAPELENAIALLKLKQTPVSAGFEYKNGEDVMLDLWQLVRDIERNKPVLLGVWGNPDKKSDKFNFDHFVLLVGYDLTKRTLVIHDPAGEASWNVSFDNFPKHRQTKTAMAYHVEFPFARRWSLKDGKKVDGETTVISAEELSIKNGQNVEKLPVANLSDADQEFVKKLK